MAAILLAIIVIRVAIVQAFATKDPGKAAAVWSGHPAVLFEYGLAELGEMAAAGRPVKKTLVERIVSASAKAPLAPEPFLVRGVEAQLAGDRALALRAFLAARQRNPRGVAARYFLADLYLKAGLTGPGLTEISALARLVPQSLPNVAPYLAAYAQTPSAAPKVKTMLETHPQLELALLNELASDAANAQLIVYLWSGRGGEDARRWQGRLLNQLIEESRFNQARVMWARFTGIAAEQDRLFDTEFAVRSLPPFGWKLNSGPSGIAESQGHGRLHALYYGREDLVLASQLMTLAPGRYRLSMEVRAGAPPPKSLSWTVRCHPGSSLITTVRLGRSGAISAPVIIPAGGCPAQWLELTAKAPEFPERAEVTISQLQLRREVGR